MIKMKGWTLVTCLLSVAFAIPLPPHPQHPGFVNFSYEVITPLKWYQSLIGHQYPHYEPFGGWMRHHSGPMLPQQHFYQSLHPVQSPLHQMNPPQPQPPLIPSVQQPAHHPFVQMTGQNSLNPQYQPPVQAGHPVQHPLPPHTAEHPMHPQQPGHSNHPVQPHQPANPIQPVFPIPQLPPLMPDIPLEPWPAADKTKQEEVD
ncbi:amelogenin, X isoform [Tiliqua scincoides]|uniref:amelogenin, X isoform n=1 Tax=Tiliqua scincoides TaxID=71010 RepID=UPI0034618E33